MKKRPKGGKSIWEKMSKKKSTPKKKTSTFYCSRCGNPTETFRYMVSGRSIRERCSSCGGNLVKRCELPPEVNIAAGPARKPNAPTAR